MKQDGVALILVEIIDNKWFILLNNSSSMIVLIIVLDCNCLIIFTWGNIEYSLFNILLEIIMKGVIM